MRKIGLLATFLPALYCAPPGDAVAAPGDYDQVCDTPGGGYFYIPGTETCLRMTGSADYQASWLENTHAIGGGTVVRTMGAVVNERFGGTFGGWIQRNGFRVGLRSSGDYGDVKVATLPLVGAYFDYEGAWGDERYAGQSAIGTDYVTRLGFTFLAPDPTYGTGVAASANGFGLNTAGALDNSWHRVNLGLKIAAPGFDGNDGDGLRVRGRAGLFYESLGTDASGQSELTFNGTPFNGYFQNYTLNARDEYFGVRVGTYIGLPPCLDGRFKTSLGADLYLGYHTGEGQYAQQTGVGGGMQVDQSLTYSRKGFAVGAGVSVAGSYEFASGWRLGSKVELSYLPQVTSFRAPQNPGEQASAGFTSTSATRVIVSMGIRRNF